MDRSERRGTKRGWPASLSPGLSSDLLSGWLECEFFLVPRPARKEKGAPLGDRAEEGKVTPVTHRGRRSLGLKVALWNRGRENTDFFWLFANDGDALGGKKMCVRTRHAEEALGLEVIE